MESIKRKKNSAPNHLPQRLFEILNGILLGDESLNTMKNLMVPNLLSCYYYKLHLDINKNQIW